MVLALAIAPAHAQLLPGAGGSSEASSGLEVLLEEARRDGSTVIVVQPNTQQEQPEKDVVSRSTEQFLELRKRLSAIFASAATLPKNLNATFRKADEELGYLWFAKALGTALLGLFIGFLLTRPYLNWLRSRYAGVSPPNPETTADKAYLLLFRAVIALTITLLYLVAAALTAVILDPGDTLSRSVIFEVVGAYIVYRILRYAVGWNLFVYDAPQNSLFNLTAEEAKSLYTKWWVSAAVLMALVAFFRLTISVGFSAPAIGFEGNGLLPRANAQLLLVILAFLAIAVMVWLIFSNRQLLKSAFTPREPVGVYGRFKVWLAKIVPDFLLVYGVAAFFMFVYRVAMLIPGASAVIIAPIVIFYVCLIIIGLAFIGIQIFYKRRLKLYQERAEAERQAQARARAEREAIRSAASDDGDEDDATDLAPLESETELTDPQVFEFKPRFRSFFENAVVAVVATLAVGRLAQIWGVPLAQEDNVWAILFDMLPITVCLILAYNAVKIFIDARMEEEGGPVEVEMGGDGGGAGVSRMATLLPIVRYVLIAIIFVAAAIVILSRLGIDIGPLLASAGVIGIAVGFGAQKLIQDIFSGAFFLLDDAFRRGEYIEIEGIKGTVEKISIRSFQLRHHLGALHTIPFGEIKQLTNYSRDWVLMKLPLRVTYDTDVDRVRKLVKKLGQELLEHPQVGHTFMQPLKSQGVYKMEDSAMIIRVKFMTKPGEQFVTRKVVYEAIQDLFAREDIHFAHKEVTVRLADDQRTDELDEREKKAVTAAARSVIDQEAEEAAQAGGSASDNGR